MNNVKLLHIKCCFFQFFNSPVALKKKILAPKKKLKWRPWKRSPKELMHIRNEYISNRLEMKKKILTCAEIIS